MILKNDYEKLLALDKAIIDSSSSIYLAKLGLLKLVTRQLQILLPAGVYEETHLKDLLLGQIKPPSNTTLSVDEQVINLAKRERCALISDDKSILLRAKQLGLNYFNTLMILLMFFARGIWEADETRFKLQHLQNVAWYDAFVWEYGWKLFDFIEEQSKPASKG